MCQSSRLFFRDVSGCLVVITGETSEEAAWDDDSNDFSPYRTALDAVGAVWAKVFIEWKQESKRDGD
jgi:hypothetical protein